MIYNYIEMILIISLIIVLLIQYVIVYNRLIKGMFDSKVVLLIYCIPYLLYALFAASKIVEIKNLIKENVKELK